MEPVVMDAEDRRELAGVEASQWWVLLRDPNVPQEQLELYVDWLRESPLHVAAMIRVARLHSRLQKFEHWDRINPSRSLEEEAVVDFPSPAPHSLQEVATPAGSEGRRRQPRSTLWAIAASALIVFTGTLLYMDRPAFTVQTERAERRELILDDGSRVQIDPESRLRVKLDETRRRIVLERGRAWFKVARDTKRPFEVEANDTIIRALGTAFAVEQQKVGVRVTVSEGKVTVSAAPATASTLFPPSQAKHANQIKAPILTANQQITVRRSGSADPIKKVDPGKELAWTRGRLVFENKPVADVMEEFNRYNPVQLRAADDELAHIPVTAVFDASDPESFVAFLESVASIEVTRKGRKEIVLATAR